MKYKNLIIALLLFISTTTYAQEVSADRKEVNIYTARRSPVLAAGLSLASLGFGGGQYYNKQYVKAGILTAINSGTLIWLLASSSDNEKSLGEAIIEVFLAGVIFTATWTFSVIDAPISAATINKRYGLKRQVSISPSFQRTPWHTNSTVSIGVKLKLSLD